MAQPLSLKDQTPVAKGLQRAIYTHPNDPTKLIKVLLPDPETHNRSGFGNLAERMFPTLRARHIRKEYLEYLRVMLANPAPDFQPPISHMYGFVSTDLGLGCLTEKICDAQGHLAVTLRRLLDQGSLSDDHLSLLNDTVTRLYDLNIRASDLKPRNFVFGHRFEGSQQGPETCVLIDGFGDIHAVPVRSLSRWTNHIGLDDSCSRMARGALVWRAKARQFARASSSSGGEESNAETSRSD